jgi:hypothetical protein
MGGPKGPHRGKKTHRADQLLNRGERREPEPSMDERMEAHEERESAHEERIKHEHPIRKTEAGYMSRGGHRR